MVYDTHVPPPRPHGQISELIRGLSVGESVYLEEQPDSVRSVIARLKAVEFGGSRAFSTAKEGSGIRVWRIKPDASQQAPQRALEGK